MRRRSHPGGDRGALLIFALIIITVVALVTGALLLQGATNFAATGQLRRAAGTAYAADAAAKQAISDLQYGSGDGTASPPVPAGPDNVLAPNFIDPTGRTGPKTWVFDNNVDGTGCFGNAGTVLVPVKKTSIDLPGFYTDSQSGTSQTATVTCTPVAGTGIFSSGPANKDAGGGGGGSGNGRALTILGSGSGALTLKVLGGGGGNRFSMHGDIADQGDLAVNNGNLYTNGTVSAASCTPSSAVIADGGVTCNATGTVSNPLSGSVPGALPVDVNGNWVVGTWSGCTFQPGYYDDAAALTAATAACTTATFVPGVYYFDFHNNSNDPIFSKPAMSPGSTSAGKTADVWTVGQGTKLVAGDSTGAGLTSTPPGTCHNTIDIPGTSSVTGAQFIFGGDSHLYLNAGTEQMEICAPTDPSGKAPIAIFGLDGSAPATGQLPVGYAASSLQPRTIPSLAATDASASGSPKFSATTGTLTQAIANPSDGNVAMASFPSTNSDTATVGLDGLSPSAPVPPGSMLKSAVLELWHQDDPGPTNGAQIAPSLQIKVGSTAAVSTANQPTASNISPIPMDAVDVTNELAPIVNAGTLGAAKFLFSESGKKGARGTLDAAKLVLSYWPPQLRGETNIAIPGNCLLFASGTPSQCNLIDGANGSAQKGSFVVQGATYIPAAGLNLALGNQAGVISLRWGLVASTATLQSQNTFPFAYPVISIPDKSPLGNIITVVDLKVFLCPGGSSGCSTSGSPALTSRVMFTDYVDPVTKLVAPYPGTRQVQVLSWAEQR